MARAPASSSDPDRSPAQGADGEPLTRLEREVAGLAARDRSTAAIAERLLLPPSTVDEVLARACRKLGVTRPSQLRQRAGVLLPRDQ